MEAIECNDVRRNARRACYDLITEVYRAFRLVRATIHAPTESLNAPETCPSRFSELATAAGEHGRPLHYHQARSWASIQGAYIRDGHHGRHFTGTDRFLAG